MEIVLTGKNFTAAEAASWGLISRVVEEGSVVDEAVKVAGKIAGKGRIAVQSAKESVNAGESPENDCTHENDDLTLQIPAYELSLKDGLHMERRLFHQLFATVRSPLSVHCISAHPFLPIVSRRTKRSE